MRIRVQAELNGEQYEVDLEEPRMMSDNATSLFYLLDEAVAKIKAAVSA